MGKLSPHGNILGSSPFSSTFIPHHARIASAHPVPVFWSTQDVAPAPPTLRLVLSPHSGIPPFHGPCDHGHPLKTRVQVLPTPRGFLPCVPDIATMPRETGGTLALMVGSLLLNGITLYTEWAEGETEQKPQRDWARKSLGQRRWWPLRWRHRIES